VFLFLLHGFRFLLLGFDTFVLVSIFDFGAAAVPSLLLFSLLYPLFWVSAIDNSGLLFIYVWLIVLLMPEFSF
jgi:hypothetical protein